MIGLGSDKKQDFHKKLLFERELQTLGGVISFIIITKFIKKIKRSYLYHYIISDSVFILAEAATIRCVCQRGLPYRVEGGTF